MSWDFESEERTTPPRLFFSWLAEVAPHHTELPAPRVGVDGERCPGGYATWFIGTEIVRNRLAVEGRAFPPTSHVGLSNELDGIILDRAIPHTGILAVEVELASVLRHKLQKEGAVRRVRLIEAEFEARRFWLGLLAASAHDDGERSQNKANSFHSGW